MQDENQVHLFNDLDFDSTAKQHIGSIASWAMVIVVTAVIGYVLNILQLFSKPKIVTRSEGFEFGASISGTDTFSTVIGIIVGLLINYFLYRFASLARRGVNSLDQSALSKSFNSLKSYFIITTVILIIVFVIVVLAVLVISLKGV
jgi:Na+/H+-translocating membrane pyrophosphatase